MVPIYGTITFGDYGEKSPANNIDGVDLFAILMEKVRLPDNDHLYGIGRSIPAHLLSTVFSDGAGYDWEIIYELQGKYVTKITVKDNLNESLKINPPYYVLTWE